ncbi:MAG: hypothetical protein NW226_06090 [Microscillaceae bacterium]|nr:hypothetical protein [Microscillaceae bacterium]
MSKEEEENKKIHIHLDGSDFEGFTLRMAGVIALSLSLIWLTDLHELLVFLCMTACWLAYFFYKIIQFKEDAYYQIIDDLEAKNQKLDKSNQLLQNVVNDSLGMKVSTKENPPKES